MTILRFGRVFSSNEEMLDPAHTALVVVDLQNDFAHPEGSFAKDGKNVSDITTMTPNLVQLVENARSAGAMVVWIMQTTLPFGLSDSAAWRDFKSRDGKNPEYTLDGSWGQQLMGPLAANPGEPVVKKYRSSAFVGTDLNLILRAAGIETLVICGCVTEGCVESTVRSSTFHDFYTFVVEDCVASATSANHEASMTVMKSRYKVFPRAWYAKIWNV